MTAWEKVELARHPKRITSKTVIEYVFDDFIELHGDRLIGDDKAIIGGIAKLNGLNVTIIAQEKGVNTSDKVTRNFGMMHPEGYNKAIRLMKQAEKFGRPIFTIIDTPGAYPGIVAEERGQARAIALAIKSMFELSVPVVSVVLSEGGSGGALAIGVSDKLYMFENSIYSILSPEGFASILYKDAKRAKEAAEIMKLTSKDLMEFRIIDGIIKEEKPLSEEYEKSLDNLKNIIIKDFEELLKTKKEVLLENRYEKYRKIGIYTSLKEK